MSYSKFERHPCCQCGVVCRFKISYRDDGTPWRMIDHLNCQPCQHKAQAQVYERMAAKHWQQCRALLAKRAAREKKAPAPKGAGG